MASTINSDNGVVSGSSGLKSTADTSGVLALQSNGSTALSIGTNLNVTLTNPLPVGSGGIGITTTPSNGQIPIGNGTNYTAANLTAGTGITITNASGSITISGSAQGPTIGLVRALAVNCILP